MTSLTKWYPDLFGEFDLVAVTQLDVADYRRYLLAEGKKQATVNHALDVLRSFFAWAVQERLVQGVSVNGVKGVPNEKKAPKWLDRKSLALCAHWSGRSSSVGGTDRNTDPASVCRKLAA